MGLDQFRRRIGIDFLAQQANEGVERIFLHISTVPPDIRDDGAPWDHPALVPRQYLEQSKFGQRKRQRLTFTKRALGGNVQHQIAGFQHIFRFGRATSLQCANPRQQFEKRKWFGEVIVCATIESPDDVCQSVAGGQHENWSLAAALTQLLDDVEAAEIRKHHVEKDQIEITLFGSLQRPLTIYA